MGMLGFTIIGADYNNAFYFIGSPSEFVGIFELSSKISKRWFF
jgi:hypothetical protein